MRRQYSIDSQLEKNIQKALDALGLSISEAKKIAQCVQKMSDFYIQNPQAPTPWNESWCLIAQIAYYLPLNHLRNRAAFDAAAALGFGLQSSSLVDFGSGLGAGSWHLQTSELFCVEMSKLAQSYHQKFFAKPSLKLISEKEIAKINDFSVVFSYSLTEMNRLPPWSLKAESILITEPSTQDDGRKLLLRRQELREAGFSMWAPCTHQLTCPLLEHSKRDWCHDRIEFLQPTWFQAIEEFLPIKNQTLTFSYLVGSKRPAPSLKKWRVIGDPLNEKGKTRQLICRGDKREFLTWMHKNGNFSTYARGDLLEPPTNFTQVSNEIRFAQAGERD